MNRSRWSCLAVAVAVALTGGCAFGPKALERTHPRYNQAVKQVTEEELLLNIVRLRYHDDVERLEVSGIAAQYELDATAEARPFFSTEGVSLNPPVGPFGTFTSILPFASTTWSNRPTITLTPLDDPDTIRGMFTPSTLDGVIFLSETSWPIATVFRLWVEYLNRVPNAPTASGPPREIVPEFRDFQRVAQLLQLLKDRGDLRFIREEKITELGTPLSADSVTAAAQVEAAKGGFEYRQRPDKTWILIRRDRRLEVKINPAAAGCPEVAELGHLLNLRPGQLSYEVTVGGHQEPFPLMHPPEPETSIHLYPRSLVQAIFYLSHGVLVPLEHIEKGIAPIARDVDGSVFDWQQLTAGLFTVHSCKHPFRPKDAHVAVKYRGYWFYLDDRDHDSKVTFGLMMIMTRVNLLGGSRKGGPTLTLPVGR